MNERINELIKQSTQELTGFDYRFGNTTTTYFNKEMFAELIIRECQNRVQKYICDCGEIGTLPDHVIKGHFGVTDE